MPAPCRSLRHVACPLLPGYLGYLTGLSADQRAASRRRTLTAAGLFILGFTIVFAALGATASTVGDFLLQNRVLLYRVAGLFIVLMGLVILFLTASGFSTAPGTLRGDSRAAPSGPPPRWALLLRSPTQRALDRSCMTSLLVQQRTREAGTIGVSLNPIDLERDSSATADSAHVCEVMKSAFVEPPRGPLLTARQWRRVRRFGRATTTARNDGSILLRASTSPSESRARRRLGPSPGIARFRDKLEWSGTRTERYAIDDHGAPLMVVLGTIRLGGYEGGCVPRLWCRRCGRRPCASRALGTALPRPSRVLATLVVAASVT